MILFFLFPFFPQCGCITSRAVDVLSASDGCWRLQASSLKILLTLILVRIRSTIDPSRLREQQDTDGAFSRKLRDVLYSNCDSHVLPILASVNTGVYQ